MLKKILINSLILSFGILLGRLSGYIRELIIAYKFGVTTQADNIILMLTIPDLLNNLLSAGLISSILIPLISQNEKIDELLSEFIRKLFVITLFLYLIAALIIFFIFEFYLFSLMCISLLSIFPNIITFVTSSYLQYEERFKAQSLNTLIFNIVIIVFLLLGFYSYIFAFSIILASLLRMLWIINDLKNTKVSLKTFFQKIEKNSVKYKLMIFMIIANGLVFINPMIDKLFASFLEEGSVAILSYAEKIYLLPVSVFLTTYAVAMFPNLSQLVNDSNYKEINLILKKSLLLNLIISSIVGVILYIFSDFIVTLFYGIAKVDSDNLILISNVLKGYVISVVFAGSLSIIINLFFAFKAYNIMIYYSTFIVLTKFLLNYLVLYMNLDVYFIALSTSILTMLSFILLVSIYFFKKVY